MERVLVSQNERNNGTDYLIVNGEISNDRNNVVYYGRKFSKTDDWNEVYKDDFLEIRQQQNQLLIKSFYNERDTINSIIYYMYLIEETDNIETILSFLEKDSQLINRTFDKERVQKVIEKIKNNESLKKNLIKYIGIAVGALALIYLLTRIK